MFFLLKQNITET